MSLVEEYYELNEADEVSSLWKTIQICFYLSAAGFGLWCGYTIANLRLEFNDKCYLYTSIKFPTLRSEKVDHGSVSWESDAWCDYCQYTMVSSFIVATIWATFFLMCGKGGKSFTGLPQPWRIVWPSLVFNLIYFVVALSASVNIQQGTDHFCFQREYNEKIQTTSIPEECEPLQFLMHKKKVGPTSFQLEIATKTSWGCTVSWLVLFLVSFLRIVFVIDFYMYRVCVFKIDDTIQNKKEEVLRITNYEEPRRISAPEDLRTLPLSVTFQEEKEDKRKRDKKSTKQNFMQANRTPLQPNAAFYVTADLRMLNRDKKGGKMSRSVDKTFEKNLSSLSRDTKLSVRLQSDLGPLGTSISLGTRPRSLSLKKEESFSSLAETEDEYTGTKKQENSDEGSMNFELGANESDAESLDLETFKSQTSIRLKKTL